MCIPCWSIGLVAAGATITRRIGVTVKRRTNKGAKATLTFRLYSPGLSTQTARVNVRVKKR